MFAVQSGLPRLRCSVLLREGITRRLPIIVFGLFSAPSFITLAIFHGSPALLLGWPLGLAVARRWPLIGIIGTSILLRLGFFDACCTDQILVAQAAWHRVVSGAGGPYGIGYAETLPPGAPFPYGPLGLIWWAPGEIVEFLAALGIMAVLAWMGARTTLAFFAVWLPSVWLQWQGANDYSAGLLIVLAMVALRGRPLVGATLLAAAVALKPYALAWSLPAIGFAGVSLGVVFVAVTALLWSPLFLWWGGVTAYLESVRLATAAHPVPQDALNMPLLRWLAVPIALIGLFARKWEHAVLVGSLVFVTFLFFDRWASHTYWMAVMPVTGLALESLVLANRLAPAERTVRVPELVR